LGISMCLPLILSRISYIDPHRLYVMPICRTLARLARQPRILQSLVDLPR